MTVAQLLKDMRPFMQAAGDLVVSEAGTGGIIVTLQTLIFLVAFVFAPKHGLLAAKRKAKQALERGPGDLAAEFK